MNKINSERAQNEQFHESPARTDGSRTAAKMIYRTDKYGNKISQLGFGCMRFKPDINDTARQLRYAVKHGINYFDTAYIYPGSEATLGKILEKYDLRDQCH